MATPKRFRVQLIIVFVFVTISSLLASTYVFTELMGQRLDTQMQDDIKDTMRLLSLRSQRPLAYQTTDLYKTLAEEIRKHSRVEGFLLQNASLKELSSDGVVAPLNNVLRESILVIDKGDYYLAAVRVNDQLGGDADWFELSGVIESEPVLGYLTVRFSKAGLVAAKNEMLLHNALILLIVSVATLVLVLALAQKLVKPLESLAGVMTLTAESGELQMPEKEQAIAGSYEVSLLQTAFRQMLESLLESQQELIDVKDAAVSAARQKSELASNVTHELRTPLQAVVGLLDLLQTMEATGEQADLIATARKSAFDLLSLVDDVLSSSRDGGTTDILHEGDVYIRSLVEEVVSLISSTALHKGVTLGYFVDDGVPDAMLADGSKLRQVMVNLIGNAVKFTQHGWIGVRVATALPGNLEIVVSDTGVGIKKENTASIFDPFKQADSSIGTIFGGTGLGLTISKQLTELMGGTIEVSSTYGEGSVFKVSIPLREAVVHRKNDAYQQATPKTNKRNAICVLSSPVEAEFVQQQLRENLVVPVAFFSLCEALDHLNSGLSGQSIHLLYIDAAYFFSDATTTEAYDLVASLRAAFPAISVCVLNNPWNHKPINIAGLRYCNKPLTRKSVADSVLTDNEHTPNSEASLRQPDVDRIYKGKEVLVVDDSRANVVIAEGILNMLGCTVMSCCNGQEAVELCGRVVFDAILMDCRMPVMDGYEAAKLIHAPGGLNQNTPILAVTANNSPSDRDKALQSGMDCHMVKPLCMDKLKDVLANWFGDKTGSAIDFESDAANESGQVVNIASLDVLRESVGQSFLNVVDAFIDDVSGYLEDLKVAIVLWEIDKVKDISHRIKGCASNVGAESLANLSARMMSSIATVTPYESMRIYSTMQEDFKTASDILESELEPLLSDFNVDGRVLLVDDDRSTRMTVKNIVQPLFDAVVEVDNGRAAYHAFLECEYDLMLIDAKMPFMDGFELCTKIRKLGADIPIIMLTSLDDAESTTKAFESGASDFVVKPVHAPSLTRRISRLLSSANSTQRMNRIALMDTLTNLPNRTSFFQYASVVLDRPHSDGRMTAVMLLDIDSLKSINDRLGFDMGDHVIQLVSTGLSQTLQNKGYLARIGGDEFVCVIEGLDSREAMEKIVERVLRSIDEQSQKFKHGRVTVSIGIALCPANGRKVGDILRSADAAVAVTREAGSSYSFYDENLTSKASLIVELGYDLKKALHKQSLTTLLQPRQEADGKNRSYELQVFWDHPQKGRLPLDVVAAAAESAGISLDLAAFILRATASLRKQMSLAGCDETVSTLIPGDLLASEGVVGLLQSAIDAYNVSPSGIELGIEERFIAGLSADQKHALNDIHSLGVNLAVYGAGASHSSLVEISSLPIRTIVLEQSLSSFVSYREGGIRGVAAILAAARALGLTTVASGIDSDHLRSVFLVELKCDLFQGALFGMPGEPNQVVEKLASTNVISIDSRKPNQVG